MASTPFRLAANTNLDWIITSRPTSPAVRLVSRETGHHRPPARERVGFAFADFLLGLALNQGTFAGNQSEGIAQVPAQTQGKQTYRALYVRGYLARDAEVHCELGPAL